MKNLSWFNKLVFGLNILLTIATVVGYVLPFLAPKMFPILAVLTLVLPLLLILNLLFFGYWLIQLKRQILLSTFVLLIGITFVNKFYKFSGKDLPKGDEDLTLMSYNVRLFNKFEWSDKKTVPVEISDFVKEINPDILTIQEYSEGSEFDDSAYQYKYILSRGKNIKTGQAILSKFKIVHTGEVVFPQKDSNMIFVDILKGNDTIRVYSMHLQSTKITPDINDLKEDINGINQNKSERMLRRLSEAFKIQQQQAEIINDHKKECSYPIIISGDMNNSAYSYVYRLIKGNLEDCFEVAGSGFGKTYDFKYYPARIDYIFADAMFEVKQFNNHIEIVDSDHFPIVARLSLKK